MTEFEIKMLFEGARQTRALNTISAVLIVGLPCIVLLLLLLALGGGASL